MLVPADQVAYQQAHIQENNRVKILAAVSVLSVLATLAIFLRVYVRHSTAAGLRTDDYLIFAAGFLVWAQFVSIYFEVSHGLGRHKIALSEHQVAAILKGILFVGPTFQFSIMLIQLSFLFFYKRVFTPMKRWFKYTLYALGFCSIGENLAVIITVLCYCTPFNYYWNKSIKGHCPPFILIYLIGLILNLVTDIAILVAPIPIIWGLQMNARSKIALTGIFLLGGLACITNLIRLPFTINVPEGDVTWHNTNAAIMGHATASIGILSACTLCYRPLFKDLRFMGSSNRPAVVSQSRSKVKTADNYKTLDGQEPSGTISQASSNIELVSHDQWDVPRTKTMAQGPTGPVDVEAGLSENVIKVTQDVDVSAKFAR